MLHKYVALVCLGGLLISASQALATTMIKPIIPPLPTPPAKAVIEPPAGYASCEVIPASWVGRVWAPLHQTCHYPNAKRVAVWVSGYWSCTLAKEEGKCKHWVWNHSHWVKVPLKREAYYNRHL